MTGWLSLAAQSVLSHWRKCVSLPSEVNGYSLKETKMSLKTRVWTCGLQLFQELWSLLSLGSHWPVSDHSSQAGTCSSTSCWTFRSWRTDAAMGTSVTPARSSYREGLDPLKLPAKENLPLISSFFQVSPHALRQRSLPRWPQRNVFAASRFQHHQYGHKVRWRNPSVAQMNSWGYKLQRPDSKV